MASIIGSMYLLVALARTLPVGTVHVLWGDISAFGMIMLQMIYLVETVNDGRVSFLSCGSVANVGSELIS